MSHSAVQGLRSTHLRRTGSAHPMVDQLPDPAREPLGTFLRRVPLTIIWVVPAIVLGIVVYVYQYAMHAKAIALDAMRMEHALEMQAESRKMAELERALFAAQQARPLSETPLRRPLSCCPAQRQFQNKLHRRLLHTPIKHRSEAHSNLHPRLTKTLQLGLLRQLGLLSQYRSQHTCRSRPRRQLKPWGAWRARCVPP